MSPKLPLVHRPEAVSRPRSRKGNPNEASGPVELRIQKSKFREVRAPIIYAGEEEMAQTEKMHSRNLLKSG